MTSNTNPIFDKVREASAKLLEKLKPRRNDIAKQEEGDDEKDKPIRETQAFQQALAQARETLARDLPRFSAAALDLGMAGGMACAIGAIATTSGLDQRALLTLMSGLGVNWLSSRVEQWRDKGKALSAEELRQLAEEIAPNLNDTRLRTMLADLDLIPNLLAQVKDNQTQLAGLVHELNERGHASRAELETCTNKVQVNIGGDVLHSLIATVGGDMNWHNVTVNLGVNDAERERLDDAIDAHLNALRRHLRKLDLDAFGGAMADTEDTELELAEIYTPLLTINPEYDSSLIRVRELGEQYSREAIKLIERRADDVSWKAAAAETGSEMKWVLTRQPLVCSLIAALNDRPRAVVLGDPGSGKSTALKYLALGLCGVRADETFADEWRHVGLVPLWVELRNFAQQAVLNGDAPETQLLTYIRKSLPHGAEALRDYLDKVLRKRGAVFLLDGLDEVPQNKRALVKDAVEGLMRLYGRCRYIITCRGYAYQDEKQKLRSPTFGMAELKVLELEDEQIELFVRKWYAQLHLRRNKPDLSGGLVAQLQDKGNPRLRQLASNPLLLTLIATLHSTGRGKLPNERQLLLKEAVDLLLVRWQRVNKRALQDPAANEAEIKVFAALEQANARDDLLSELYALAFEVHKQAPAQQIAQDEATADIPEALLRNALERVLRGALANRSILPDDLTEYLRNRAGLLINVSDDPNTPASSLSEKRPVYRFPHRMFQEYMAAMRYHLNPSAVAPLVRADVARWREVYALMALINSEPGTRDCLEEICPLGETPQTEADWQCAILAANTWADKLKPNVELSSGIKRHIAHVAGLINKLLLTPALLSPAERAGAGRTLTRLPSPDSARFTCGDVRHAACANLLTAEGLQEYVTNGFVAIEPEEFVMQAGTEYAGIARVAEPYSIGKTPVTCAQFAAFVREGYREDRFWTANGLQWRDERVMPIWWDSRLRNIDNYPVVGVSWYEAIAFCNWLNEQMQTSANKPGFSEKPGLFALPTELEWEFAARGTTGRRYPWVQNASEDWQDSDEQRCNMVETKLERAITAGIFVDGATPEGVFDLSGNVMERMSTRYEDNWREAMLLDDMKPYDPDKSQIYDCATLRGGSFRDPHKDVTLGIRLNYHGGNWIGLDIGFRVVLRDHLPPL